MIGPSLQHPEEGLACPLSSSDLAASVIVLHAWRGTQPQNIPPSRYVTFFFFQPQISGPHLSLHLSLACHAIPCARGTRLSSSASGGPSHFLDHLRHPFSLLDTPFVLVPSLEQYLFLLPTRKLPPLFLSPLPFSFIPTSPLHLRHAVTKGPTSALTPPTIQIACSPSFRHHPTCRRRQHIDSWLRNKPAPHGRLHPPSPTP